MPTLHEVEVLEIGSRIQDQVQSELGKGQREFFLREQLKAIQENNPNAPLYPPTAIDRAAGISQGADAGGGLPAP